MYSPAPLVDARRAAYARFASRVLECLNDAVDKRQREGATRAEIAAKLGVHRSRLTRILNGTVPNLTLRTVSDVLWATDFEPRDFEADPLEIINQNCPTFLENESAYLSLWATTCPYKTHIISATGEWGEKSEIKQSVEVGVGV